MYVPASLRADDIFLDEAVLQAKTVDRADRALHFALLLHAAKRLLGHPACICSSSSSNGTTAT